MLRAVLMLISVGQPAEVAQQRLVDRRRTDSRGMAGLTSTNVLLVRVVAARRGRSPPCRPTASAARARWPRPRSRSGARRRPPRAEDCGVSVCRRLTRVRQKRIVDSRVLEEEVLRGLRRVHGDVEILVVGQRDPDGLIQAQVQAVALGRGRGDAATLAGLGARPRPVCAAWACDGLSLGDRGERKLATATAKVPRNRNEVFMPRLLCSPHSTQRADECFG